MSPKSPGLRDLLRLSFSEPVVWLCGPGEEDRAVEWVSISVEEARSGDLLLIPAAQLNAELLSQAQKKELAALLLLGEASLPEPAPAGDLAMLLVPEPEGDLRAVQRILLTNLINQRAGLLERGARIHAQLAQMEADGKGLEGLVKVMAEISGRGVLIQDKRGNILAEHSASTLLAIWKDVLEQLSSLESLPENLVDRKRAGSQRTVSLQKIPGGLERLVAPVSVGEVARGYLSLVGVSGELDELDNLVIEQGGLVCAVEMARNKAVREAEKRLKGDLLTALLQDNLAPREARLWVQAMGFDPSQAHVALRFSWDGPSPPSRRRLETLVNGEVSRLGLRAIVSPMGAEVICFCPEQPGASRPELSLALGEAVLEQQEREHPGARVYCGIGTIALALEEWRTSLRRAGQALEMAGRLGERKPLYYADLSVYRLLLQLEHSPELIAFQEETLGLLLANEGADELIHTLETYFDNNGNLSQAAEALFIHRNTLIYRMERIAGMLKTDLDNPENRLAIQLALRIYRMMKRSPAQPH